MTPETEEKVIDLTDILNKMSASLSDITENIKKPPVKVEAKVDGEPKAAEIATMDDPGIFSDAMSFEIMNVPVGKALIGGAIAIFATELIDGFFATSSTTTKGVIKLAGAAGTIMFLRKPLGNVGAGAVALLLTFDALRDLTPLDTWMASLATKITGVATTAGLADHSGRRMDVVNQQANKVANDYYAQAEGRR